MSMRGSFKEKLSDVFGAFGTILFSILSVGLTFLIMLPLYIIDFPWWAFILITAVAVIMSVYAVILEPVFYIWALVIVVQGGCATWLSVLYYIVFAFWALKFLAIVGAFIADLFSHLARRG